MSKEKYNVSYGTEDSVYGCIVTNVLDLPDGTFFRVHNGAWTGCVDSDESGNKVVYAGVKKVYPVTDFVNKIVFQKKGNIHFQLTSLMLRKLEAFISKQKRHVSN